jgi:hypothetical protein
LLLAEYMQDRGAARPNARDAICRLCTQVQSLVTSGGYRNKRGGRGGSCAFVGWDAVK